MEAAKDGDAASRRRVDQAVKFPDANDLLTAIMAFLDIRTVCVAAQMSRRWRRAAVTPALWQGFVQRRWPDVWSGLAARKALDARAVRPAGLSPAAEGDDARGSLGSLRAQGRREDADFGDGAAR